MLTPEEKWFFDHHGFIILRQVVPPEDIELMIELGNQWHDMKLEELPPPLTSTSRNSAYNSTIAHWINNIQYGDAVFQRLVLNIEIMRVIIALTRSAPCLVDCALTKNYTTSDDINFHASGQDYGVENGEPHAGLLMLAPHWLMSQQERVLSVYPEATNVILTHPIICQFTTVPQPLLTSLSMPVIVSSLQKHSTTVQDVGQKHILALLFSTDTLITGRMVRCLKRNINI